MTTSNGSLTCPSGPTIRFQRGQLTKVALGVFAIKGYMLVLLYVIFTRVELRPAYEPFLFLEDGETRRERVEKASTSFIERLSPYDGQYYRDIARRGYRRLKAKDANARAGPRGNFAFFPLLPFVLAILGGGGTSSVALALALNVALSGLAMVGLFVLARRLNIPAWPAVLLTLAFPTAIFQSALYTESLFLFLSVGVALLSTCRSSTWLRAPLAFLCGLCRPQGILVAVFAGIPRGSRRVAKSISIAAPFVGLAVFCAILWFSIGAPLGFLGIQSHWARSFTSSSIVTELLSPSAYKGPPFDILAVLLGVGLLPFLWRHLPPSLALFGTLSVAMPLATGTILSFGRFLSVSFPHFLVLAKLLERAPVARGVLVAGFLVLQGFVAKGLVGWYFVG